jgi:hypothetical protein
VKEIVCVIRRGCKIFEVYRISVGVREREGECVWLCVCVKKI